MLIKTESRSKTHEAELKKDGNVYNEISGNLIRNKNGAAAAFPDITGWGGERNGNKNTFTIYDSLTGLPKIV